ncbi:AAA family ATPase [candidate division TA06 bacterium]|nr:AAA family ATPase [candidate division TA06 bacterium]
MPVPRPRLHKLTISNFRCIGPDPIEIELDDIVVLVGPNNSGKSSILRAYEIVMLHGSDEGKLSKDDFPDGVFDPLNIPTIELETVVFDKTAPGERWVRTDAATGEMFVREKWTWTQPGVPKKVGWDNTIGAWHENECPWGAPNVAQAYRPEPIRVDAFQKPEEQAEKVISLLTKAIEERVKELSKKKSEEAGGGLSIYEKLLDTIKQLRISIAADATAAVGDVQTSFASMLGEVFPGYSVIFDPRPEENVDKSIILYKPNPLLKIGPSGGFQSTIDRQGSGTCRTLIWTALRILAERPVGKTATQAGRAHLLLMDEPEICLHPDAIREACRVLYDLPNTKNWQVMITTHSPVFIDLSRDNTSIARVELLANGKVRGTTIYRPQKARLDDDDRTELKLLNLCDPYVSEFFFGGKTILVEGDTEYTAFKHIVAQDRSKYKNIHIVRARGKACLVSLCKVLNQFNKDYAVLHDADREKVISKKTKAERSNSAWSENQKILTVTETGRTTGHIRLLASVPNFEEAFFGEAVTGDKPYSALARLKTDDATFLKISSLLDCLVDFSAAVPDGAKAWASIDELKVAVTAFDGAKPMPASK